MRAKNGWLKTLVTAAVMASASLAMAQDAKLISGAACNFLDGSTFHKFSRSNFFQNASGATRDVACSFVKDNIGGQVTSAAVLTSSTVTSCFITKHSPTNIGTQSFTRTTTNPGGTKWIEWTTAFTANAQSLTVICSVPHGATIYAFQLSEPS